MGRSRVPSEAESRMHTHHAAPHRSDTRRLLSAGTESAAGEELSLLPAFAVLPTQEFFSATPTMLDHFPPPLLAARMASTFFLHPLSQLEGPGARRKNICRFSSTFSAGPNAETAFLHAPAPSRARVIADVAWDGLTDSSWSCGRVVVGVSA